MFPVESKMASLVLCPFQQPYCPPEKILCLAKNFMTLLCMTFSSTFDITGRSDTGR